MPAAEVDITAGLIRELLGRQFPAFAGRRIELLAFGWDNALFRLGDDLIVRLPRRAAAVPLMESEQRWLPVLAPRLPLPVPVPLGCGVADEIFPWPWSICRFHPGRSVLGLMDAGDQLDDPVACAARLGAFFAALHRPAPADAPPNPYRGVPLADRDERMRDHLDQLDGVIDGDAVLRIWTRCLDLPVWDGPALWVHGDPHPGNAVAHDGRISAVVDFGDITAGDPASDVAAGWLFFERNARAAFRRAVGVDDATWARGRGWALCLGVAMVANSADNAPYHRLGIRTIEAVLADDP